MASINCVEMTINKDNTQKGLFILEPLEVGQGITVGNSLRRVLLSDLTGYAINGVRINNLKHEFTIIEGIREDTLEVLLNLKEIIFKSNFVKNYTPKPLIKAFLKVQGPLIVTAGLFNLPENSLKIINPEQYICTILDKSDLYLEVDISNGKGYTVSTHITETKSFNTLNDFPATLSIDSIYMPVKKVNFKIKLIHDNYGNIKESLNLEIITNGSISPKRSLFEALKILSELFFKLFLNQEVFKISKFLTIN